jgi:hypothetical protein
MTLCNEVKEIHCLFIIDPLLAETELLFTL